MFYPFGRRLGILTCTSLEIQLQPPDPLEDKQLPTSAEGSQRQVQANMAPSPPVPHPVPRLQAHTPTQRRIPSHHLLHHTVYPSTLKYLLYSTFQPPASRNLTPTQHWARKTSPTTPPTHPTPLKSPFPAFHQPTLPRPSAAADPVIQP